MDDANAIADGLSSQQEAFLAIYTEGGSHRDYPPSAADEARVARELRGKGLVTIERASPREGYFLTPLGRAVEKIVLARA